MSLIRKIIFFPIMGVILLIVTFLATALVVKLFNIKMSFIQFTVFFGILISLFIWLKSVYKETLEEMEQDKQEIIRQEADNKDALNYISKIKQFNISNIGQKYKVFSAVESQHDDKNVALGIICRNAKRLGANAIINLQMQIETKTSGSTHTSREVFDNRPNVVGHTTSESIFYYTATAVKLEDD